MEKNEDKQAPSLEDLKTAQNLLLHRRTILLGRIASRRGFAQLNYYRLRMVQDSLRGVDADLAAAGYDPVNLTPLAEEK